MISKAGLNIPKLLFERLFTEDFIACFSPPSRDLSELNVVHSERLIRFLPPAALELHTCVSDRPRHSCSASHSERKKVSTETLNSLFSRWFSGARFKELNHTRMCSLGHAENPAHDLGLLKVSPFTLSSSGQNENYV